MPASAVCSRLLRRSVPLLLLLAPLVAAGRAGAALHTRSTAHALDLYLLDVTCPSPTTCVAVGQAGDEDTAPHTVLLWSTDAGATWRGRPLPISQTVLAITCSSATACLTFLEDNLLLRAQPDGGWSAESVSFSDRMVHPLRAIACPTTAVCYAADRESGVFFRSDDGGRNWTPSSPTTRLRGPQRMACPAITTCLAVGRGGLASTSDGGSSWIVSTVVGLSGDPLGQLACPTVSTCFLANGGLVVTTDGGTTWGRSVPWPLADPRPPLLSGIACATPQRCLAVGSSGTEMQSGLLLTTSDGGGTWVRQAVPAIGKLSSVACTPTAICLAVGQFGTILRSTDAGGTWAARMAPAVAPLAPKDFQATALDATSVVLDWRSAEDADAVVIDDDRMHEVAHVGAGQPSYTVHDLTPGSYVCFIAYASNGGGNSDWSAWACTTLLPADTGRADTMPLLLVSDTQFSPTTVVVRAGERITLTLHNAGDYCHNWHVLDVHDDQGKDIKTGPVCPSLREATVTFVISTPGSYPFQDDLLPMSVSGGTLIVR